ncbi:hypothetical protein GCM10023210_42130 [Chryseobacterium ginsengisoli]|uniref:Thrombospondin n=1 Tax=Chryseobacterium ginsengisoli TaxID=363853 RepID=A0ABP9MTY7_9FLAO
MKKYFIFLLFLFLNLHSQQIINKEEFKKCKKEFSKKICLSDDDKDSILFYLDKCPKENGPAENFGCPFPDTDDDGIIDKDDACPKEKGEIDNNGCPWYDIDGDGILDKDDACPTLPGVPEENGCPRRGDCKEYFEKEKQELINFKEKNNNDKAKFIALRKIIFNNVSKEFLAGESMFVSIYVDTFINENITFQCSSRSTLYHDKQLFLDQLFWSKETFEYVAKKLNKNIVPTFGLNATRTINKDFINELKKDGYYGFMLNFPKVKAYERSGLYYPRNKQKPKFDGSDTRLVVNFSHYDANDEVVAKFSRLRDEYFYTYKYVDNQWKLINTEKHKY